MKKKLSIVMGALLVGSMVLTGCGSGAGGAKVSVVGSTTVAVPMEELAAKYKEKNPNVTVEVQGVGSSAGIKAANEGTAQIGMSSRTLKEEEKAFGLTETVVAYDGIAVVLNPANGVEDLTADQVKKIFLGEIKNWSEVGGSDQEIILVSREAGSGTRDAFEEIMKLQEEKDGKKISSVAPTALVAEGNGTVKATVGTKEGAVGYLSIGYIDETVKPVKIDGVVPTEDAVKAGEYKISRPLLVVTKPDAAAETKAFVDFMVSPEGQEVVGEKYVPVGN